MENLRYRFKSYLARKFIMKNHDSMRHEISQKSKLLDLPLDLFLMICDFLPPVDLNCLSLCSRGMYLVYSTYYRKKISLTEAEKLSLLTRLESDQLEYFTCYICNKLHRYDGSESFGLSGPAKNKTSTLPCDYKGYDPEHVINGKSPMTMRTHNDFAYSESRLSHTQVKLAMRRYRYGAKYGISTDSLSYIQVRNYFLPKTPTKFPNKPTRKTAPNSPIYGFYPTLFSMEAQVCPEPPSLHVRVQDILLFENWKDLKFQLNNNPLGNFEICHHQTLSNITWACIIFKDFGITSMPCHCWDCGVAGEIRMIKVFDSKIALIMTKWLNLGSGLDHNDPLWQVRAYSLKDEPEQIARSQNLKDLRICFENQALESSQELQSRNLSYLEKERYKKGKPFIQNSSHIWHIPYKEPSPLGKVLEECGLGSALPRLWRRITTYGDRPHAIRPATTDIIVRKFTQKEWNAIWREQGAKDYCLFSFPNL